MLKLHRVLATRNQLLELLSSRKAGVAECLLHRHNTSYSAGFSTATDNYVAKVAGYASTRIYAPYSVFKGKAAFSLRPCLPTFTKLDSGAEVVDRRGSIMMSFMHAIGERKYDWDKKQMFALSATEVGSLIAMGPQDSCEFFHDPSMKSSNAGQVRKSLSIKPHTNSSGYFISLTVVNNLSNTKEFFSVPVTAAEFAVMKTACSFALPRIMGWDRVTHQESKGSVGLGSGAGSGVGAGFQSKVKPEVLDLEWDK